ncbi:Zn-dependent exopeptidase [Xylariaceae sp. FL1272]|nr:Zn-dependent exopeptidase [Xylariaceae sp. FL1272]
MKVTGLALLLSSSLEAFAYSVQQPLGTTPTTDSIGHGHHENKAPDYRVDLLALHKSLVEISSITSNETTVGHWLADYLEDQGFSTYLQYIPSGDDVNKGPKPRFNVIAKPWPKHQSSIESPKVIVSSHIDTVPPFIPYSCPDDPPNSDTVIAGRGTVDAKASVAAQITAVIELLSSGSIDADNIVLVYVVGEERSGDGMKYFSKSLLPLDPPPNIKAAIFGEPTEGKLACGHKGITSCTVKANGKAGHSGYPWLGKSATEILMRGMVKVLDTDLGSSAEFGNTTVNVGLLEGGVAPNVIPEMAEATMAVRVAIGPEEKGGSIVGERIRDVLKGVDEDAFDVNCVAGYGVVKCECEVDGFETITVNYGTDVPNLAGNHTRYLYGPGSILVAHGADEAIKVSDLETGVEDFKKLILHALKN